MDNAVCGGPDTGSSITTTAPPINAQALNQIKAVIEMGSPRFVAGLSYNVGTCTAQGVCCQPSLAPLFISRPLTHLPTSSSPPALAATSAAPTRRPR